MANFTVRVELHSAEWTDYEQLHAAMEQKRFFPSDYIRRWQNLSDALG